METYEAKGVLKFGGGVRVAIWLAPDNELAPYYRSLIPKAKYVQPQMYSPHVTVVRSGGAEQPDMQLWEETKQKYEGEVINFSYSPLIKFDYVYYYLDVFCDRIGELRRDMGLPTYRFDDNKKYHITIGNLKKRD
jgi:hypothetical protein